MRWIIGDVHGMLTPLRMLLAAIGKIDAQAQLIFVGDYVNRGPDSKGVVDLLLGLSNARFIRGNHDDIFDQVLGGHCYALNASSGNRGAAFAWFMQHGLDQTLLSYGADLAELHVAQSRPDEARLSAILQGVPQAHRDFFRNLLPVVEEEDLFVAHGKWDPDDLAETPPIGEQLARDAGKRERILWGRFDFQEVLRLKAWKRIGYFGHTPVDAYPELQQKGKMYWPIMGNKLVLLDTAAALRPAGRLTAYCHESRGFIQVDRGGKVVPS